MNKRPLDSAIQVVSRNIVEGRIPQIHAETLHVGNLYQVGIRGGIVHPIPCRGTKPQGFFGLGRNEQAIRFVGKGRDT